MNKNSANVKYTCAPLLIFATMFLVCCTMYSSSLAGTTIVNNGKSTFTIVIPQDAPTTLQEAALELQQHFAGKLQIFYVLPDYFESRPKPCMHGWGRRYLTVNPHGEVLPCPTASAIPNMRFENVRQQPLEEIWLDSESFNRFRGTEWMPEPCQSCPQEIDRWAHVVKAAIATFRDV